MTYNDLKDQKLYKFKHLTKWQKNQNLINFIDIFLKEFAPYFMLQNTGVMASNWDMYDSYRGIQTQEGKVISLLVTFQKAHTKKVFFFAYYKEI